MNHERLQKLFSMSVGVILAITGVVKVWSAMGDAKILQSVDPIFSLRFGQLLLAVGILELLVAAICIFGKTRLLVNNAIAWLSTNLLAYRLALWWVDWRHPCPCLGGLADAIHISPQTANLTMKIVLAYLLVGSYASLFSRYRQRKTPPRSLPI